ncbi:MAG: tandem-95 repeat protein [Candidatus Neomarinimicrobiota bacterium]
MTTTRSPQSVARKKRTVVPAVCRCLLPLLLCSLTPGQGPDQSDSLHLAFTDTIPAVSIDSLSANRISITPPEFFTRLDTGFTLNEDESTLLILPGQQFDSAGTFTYSLLSPPHNGTISHATFPARYTPGLNYSGPDSFTYLVSDSVFGDTGTVILDVRPINDPPVFSRTVLDTVIAEDSQLLLSISALVRMVKDIDNQSTDFVFRFTDSGFATVRSTPGQLLLQPPPDWFGRDSLRLEVSDGRLTDSLDLLLRVTPVNDKPSFTITHIDTSAPEGTALELVIERLIALVVDNDSPDSLLQFFCGSTAAIAAEVRATGIRLVPRDYWFGNDTLQLSVSDGFLSDTIQLFLTIIPVNDPPRFTATPDQLRLREDLSLELPFNNWYPIVFDPDHPDSGLVWRMIGTEQVTVTNSPVACLIAGRPDWFGLDTLEIIVSDGEFSCNGRLPVYVVPVNDPPVIAPLPVIRISEDSSATLPLQDYVTDVDDEPTSLIWYSHAVSNPGTGRWTGFWPRNQHPSDREPDQPTYPPAVATERIWLGIDPATQIATVHSAPDFNSASARLILEVVDPGGRSAFSPLTVIIDPVNDPPQLQALDKLEFSEDARSVLPVSRWFPKVQDQDNRFRDLIWQVADGKHIVAANLADSIEFNLPTHWSGRDTLQVFVSDGQYRDSSRLLVDVVPVNDPPAAFSLIEHLLVDSILTLSWYPSFDIENDSIRYLIHLEGPDLDTVTIARSNTLNLNLAEIEKVVGGVEYRWFVEASDGQDTIRSNEIFYIMTPNVPKKFRLLQNYPNPFNALTAIPFELPRSESVCLTIYDIHGRKVRCLIDEELPRGYHEVHWDGSDGIKTVASGIYVVELRSTNYRGIKKIMLIK